jgi:uncharacterized membrane protein
MIPYLWVKAAHVAAVLIFIGGLFAQSFAVVAGRQGDAVTVMLVSRWDGRVTLPAMLVVWLSGALLAAEGAWFAQGWLWAKLAFVLLLTGLHAVQSGKLRRVRPAPPAGIPSPALGLIAVSVALIALLVVVKPF